MMADVLGPGSELTLTVRGYEVIVRTTVDGTLHITCPDLPQLSVSSPTVTDAISRTEDAINAIIYNQARCPLRAHKEGRGMTPTNQLYVSLTAVVIATAV